MKHLRPHFTHSSAPLGGVDFRASPRRGAALLITLGILSVLAVLAVAFFSAARIQRQTAKLQHNRATTRNLLDEALALAMQTLDDALCYTNFTDAPLSSATDTPDGTTPPTSDTTAGGDNTIIPQRLAPLGRWFSDKWRSDNEVAAQYDFQHESILLSPIIEATANLPNWRVNLLTPEVTNLIPPLLLNKWNMEHQDPPLLAGWQETESPGLQNNGTRIAFAIIDASGFLDINYLADGPTTQKVPRVAFAQADIANWLPHAQTTKAAVNEIISRFAQDPDNAPFTTLSYDPDPDSDPFDATSIAPHPRLGKEGYAQAHHRKFDINSFTNWIGRAADGAATGDASASGNWTLSPQLMAHWLRPLASTLTRANQQEEPQNPDKLATLQIASVPWNFLNFIDADRIPQLSIFSGIDLATRHNAAIEDVPLINKVTIFNIFGDQDGSGNPPPPHFATRSYYGDLIPNDATSNHYGVAVEVWYPFAPNSPPPSSAIYVGVYTNEADVGTTTTNRPLTNAELRDWFDWQEAATSNTVMQTLFNSWANEYVSTVGPAIWSHPLWQIVTTNSEVWFTPDMSNTTVNANWPVADTNGLIDITTSPVWHSFYPDTYDILFTNLVEEVTTNELDVVSTNLLEVVTTNTYTYLTITNLYLHSISDDGTQTNRLLGQIGVTEPEPYPVLLWEDQANGAFTTNLFGAFVDENAELHIFYDPATGFTNHLLHFYIPDAESVMVISSNDTSGVVATNLATELILAPWDENNVPIFVLHTNLYIEVEILPVPPLPMPEDLGASLAALFGLLQHSELQLNTSGKLYDFLMLTASEFDDYWDFLLGYLADFPLVQQTIMPSYREADLGNLTDEDRYDLTLPGEQYEQGEIMLPPQDINGTEAGPIPPDAPNGFGTYWLIFPRKVISFPEVEIIQVPEAGIDDREMAVTNYYALGAKPDYRAWVRPVITANTNGPQDRATDRIVDEALLTGNLGESVYGWPAVTNLCVADPRHNAYANYWRGFPHPDFPLDPPEWDSAVSTTNCSTEVTEYPFFHLNQPLEFPGDIGHIYTSPDRLNLTRVNSEPWQGDRSRPLHDTITFASTNGAALLDMLTVNANPPKAAADPEETTADEATTPSNPARPRINRPTRGLVQANTPHEPVIQTLFSYGTLGWTNVLDQSTEFLSDLAGASDLSALSHAYREALLGAAPAAPNGVMGWRSFADMLPAIANHPDFIAAINSAAGSIDSNISHDWIEDALRDLPTRVSFRQNIYIIILAAQTTSPLSTPTRPVILSEQRAALTIIRDAFTGRWAIQSWRWLTQ